MAKLWIYSYIFITYTHIFILALTETMVIALMYHPKMFRSYENIE